MKAATILLVEDDTDVLSLNQAHLEGQGYEVRGAKTLSEARNLLWEYPPESSHPPAALSSLPQNLLHARGHRSKPAGRLPRVPSLNL